MFSEGVRFCDGGPQRPGKPRPYSMPPDLDLDRVIEKLKKTPPDYSTLPFGMMEMHLRILDEFGPEDWAKKGHDRQSPTLDGKGLLLVKPQVPPAKPPRLRHTPIPALRGPHWKQDGKFVSEPCLNQPLFMRNLSPASNPFGDPQMSPIDSFRRLSPLSILDPKFFHDGIDDSSPRSLFSPPPPLPPRRTLAKSGTELPASLN